MSLVRLPRLLRTTSFGLAVLYTLLFAGSTVILGTLVYVTVRSSLDRQMTTRIDAEIELLRQEFTSEGNMALVAEVKERSNLIQALAYLVTDAHGNRLAGNLPSMPAGDGWTNVNTNGARANDPPRHFRIRSITLDHGMRLAVGDDLAPTDDIRTAFLEALGWSLLAFAVLSLSGGALLSLGFLRRVDAITRTAEAIIAGELGRRIPVRGTNDNLDRLSDTLNAMLDRIETLMDSLRHVSNDIAHALRTPLGRLQQKLEVARIAAASNPKCKRAVNSAMAETTGILDTFSALLRIAQIEAGTRRVGFAEVDISTLFETLADAYLPAAEDQGKTITVDVAPALSVWGDKELLTEMVANLLDNAIRHTPVGTGIRVALANCSESVTGIVSDTGPGIPPSERDRVFQRFYRMDQSTRTPGHGLGLSLVAAVAELHGIELNAKDNVPGLCMVMRFSASN